MYDCVHPYATGYTKMADEWLQGLLTILPRARAGADQDANPGAAVTLDGTGSTDSLGRIVSYIWSQNGGTPVTLDKPNSSKPSFTAPSVVGGTTLTFSLTITDDKKFTHSDACSVFVNGPPIADAKADPVAITGATVTLHGTGSEDPGGDIAAYQCVQTAGIPVVELVNRNSSQAAFVAPPVGSGGADLSFELTVTDVRGAQDAATCSVHVNGPPVADAGAGQTVKKERP